jgi:hypothetical protein
LSAFEPAAWLYDLLKPRVTETLLCNPRKIPLLKHGNKFRLNSIS